MKVVTVLKEKIAAVRAQFGEVRELCHCKKERTALTVGAILREHLDDYRKVYPLTYRQGTVLGALMACRTGLLGGHIKECVKCGAKEFWYKSCRDRHCPTCGKFKRAEWVAKQRTVLLPIPYYHAVFTTDHLLNEWAPLNREMIYNLLFRNEDYISSDS